MPKELLEILQIDDTNKLKNMYDSLFVNSDLVNVNLKAEKAIKSNAIVSDSDILSDSKDDKNILDAVADVYVNQKWFLFAKAILVSKQPQYSKTIYDKLKYNALDDESAIQEYKMRLEVNVPEDGPQPSDEELELNAHAMCLADMFITDEKYRAEFSREGQFSFIIDEALKKDPNFIAKSNKVEITKALVNQKMYYLKRLEEVHTEEDLQNVANSVRTQSQIDYLKAQNDDLKDIKEAADAEISAKQNIRTLQQERNCKSVFWKIFRPISNLVSYIKLNNAKNTYKEAYILPKLEQFKNDDNYNEKVANAMDALNEEISSDRQLTSAITAPKVYTKDELENIDIEEKTSDDNSEFLDEENLEEVIENEFDNEQELDDNIRIEPSKDDIQLDISKDDLAN